MSPKPWAWGRMEIRGQGQSGEEWEERSPSEGVEVEGTYRTGVLQAIETCQIPAGSECCEGTGIWSLFTIEYLMGRSYDPPFPSLQSLLGPAPHIIFKMGIEQGSSH